MLKHKTRKYRCTKCGTITKIKTNHVDLVYCGKCPNWPCTPGRLQYSTFEYYDGPVLTVVANFVDPVTRKPVKLQVSEKYCLKYPFLEGKITYKFLVLVGDSEALVEEELVDWEHHKRIVSNDRPYLQVIQCKHPMVSHNFVIVDLPEEEDQIGFIEDINGNLYYFEQIFTQEEVNRLFEG